ncbi:MAG: helix-hairpin-helix domain-containing protein [Bacteroidota bacterium]
MVKILRRWIMNTFGFSKSETNGSLILLTMVMLTGIIPRLIMNKTMNHEVSVNKDKITLRQWYSSIKNSVILPDEETLTESTFITEESPSFDFVSFNPNSVSIDALLKMGFPNQVATNMINYRNAGGSYKIKSDLKKVYGMSDNLYTGIEPFIELPTELDHTAGIPKIVETKESTIERNESIISINKASAMELQSIYGIGPTLSERIIKYRNLLGGFYSTAQLNEVYGLETRVIEEIESRVIIDSTLTMIDINSVEQKELSSHPYINYSLAKAILNYRKVHGPFQKKSDLKLIKIVSDSTFNKLSPYISVRP